MSQNRLLVGKKGSSKFPFICLLKCLDRHGLYRLEQRGTGKTVPSSFGIKIFLKLASQFFNMAAFKREDLTGISSTWCS